MTDLIVHDDVELFSYFLELTKGVIQSDVRGFYLNWNSIDKHLLLVLLSCIVGTSPSPISNWFAKQQD